MLIKWNKKNHIDLKEYNYKIKKWQECSIFEITKIKDCKKNKKIGYYERSWYTFHDEKIGRYEDIFWYNWFIVLIYIFFFWRGKIVYGQKCFESIDPYRIQEFRWNSIQMRKYFHDFWFIYQIHLKTFLVISCFKYVSIMGYLFHFSLTKIHKLA